MNVPLDENRNVADDTRIKAILPTINFLKEKGAKIILVTHLGRPDGKKKPEFNLDPVAKRLSELLGEPVLKLDDCIGDDVKAKIATLKDGEIALLENIRFYKEETDNDPEFSKKLASLADIYVNDAFGTAHRAHSSTEGVAKLLNPAVSGLLMEKEVSSLGELLTNPQRPFTAVVGGAKVSSKIAVLENLIDNVDNLVIGGGMAYTFLKAQGYSVGKSICEPDQMDVAKKIMEKAEEKGVKIYFPIDVLAADDFSQNANTKIVDVKQIPDDWQGVDAGSETMKLFKDVILNSKTVLMNGPVGVFEIDKFSEGTKEVLKAMEEATKNGTMTVIGGGDSVAAAKKYEMPESSFSHVSTGGGASLEFIEGKELPGVAALNDQ